MDPEASRLNTVYLSLGSNIEPEANLKAAVALLGSLTELVAVSSVWETRPLGYADQANFLNAAAIVKTRLSVLDFKRNVIRPIERKLHRVRSRNKNGPRTIDLDIVLFNRQIFNLAHNHIPDPDLLERPFMAVTLAEIAPDYRHPETGQLLRDIAAKFVIKAEEMRLRPDVSQALQAVRPNRSLQAIIN